MSSCHSVVSSPWVAWSQALVGGGQVITSVPSHSLSLLGWEFCLGAHRPGHGRGRGGGAGLRLRPRAALGSPGLGVRHRPHLRAHGPGGDRQVLAIVVAAP